MFDVIIGGHLAQINEIDRRVLSGLSGADRLRALIRAAGYQTYRDFCVETGTYVGDLSACISGTRPHNEIRDLLAEKLTLSREQVDELIDFAT